jgi:hypothetical protein
VGPRAGLDVVEKKKMLPLPGVEPRLSSLSLYRLSYAGHLYVVTHFHIQLFISPRGGLCETSLMLGVAKLTELRSRI